MTYHHSRTKIVVVALVLGLLLLFACIAVYLNVPRPVNVPKPQPMPSNGVAYGVNVDMTALIPDTPYTVHTANGGDFFDLAAQLGINTLRITDIRWAISGEQYSWEAFNNVFNEANYHHINIILLLVDGGEHTALERAHTLLGQYGLAQSPALWMVDLDNEPDVGDPRNMAQIREEAAYVRQVAPRVRVTIGGWKSEFPGHPGMFSFQNPSDIPKFVGLVDVVSAHLYRFDQEVRLGYTPQQWVQRYLDAVRLEAQGKPILLGEFGAGNGLAPTTESTPTGSPQWQAYVYRGVFQEVTEEHAQGVLGALAWIITPRPAWPHTDPTNHEGDMTGWAFVLNQGQRLLPAAQEISPPKQSG